MDGSVAVCNCASMAVMLWEVRVPLSVIANVRSTWLLQRTTEHSTLSAIFETQSEYYHRVALIVSTPFTNACGASYEVLLANLSNAIHSIRGKLHVGC